MLNDLAGRLGVVEVDGTGLARAAEDAQGPGSRGDIAGLRLAEMSSAEIEAAMFEAAQRADAVERRLRALERSTESSGSVVGLRPESIELATLPRSTPAPVSPVDDMERACFICLEQDGPEGELVSCCSTCYAVVHASCWQDWRTNQRAVAMRSRLLGQNPAANPFLCTICKSGTAMAPGDAEADLGWAEAAAAQVERPDTVESDGDDSVEDEMESSPVCHTMVAVCNLTLLALIAVLDAALVSTHRLYAGDVAMYTLLFVYEAAFVQMVVLAIVHRRHMYRRQLERTQELNPASAPAPQGRVAADEGGQARDLLPV